LPEEQIMDKRIEGYPQSFPSIDESANIAPMKPFTSVAINTPNPSVASAPSQ
jgi:hypothetical protein